MAPCPRVTVTQVEERVLRDYMVVGGALDGALAKTVASLLRKCDQYREKRKTAVDKGGYPVQRFLDRLKKCRKMAVPKTAPAVYYTRLTTALAAHGGTVTDENIELVCKWLLRQTWMIGTTTPEQVVRHWTNWLARAESDRAPAPAGPVELGS